MWAATQDCICVQRRQSILAGRSKSSLSAWRRFVSLVSLRVPCEDSDQPARMCRLIWVFDGRTCDRVGNAESRVISHSSNWIFFKILFRLAVAENVKVGVDSEGVQGPPHPSPTHTFNSKLHFPGTFWINLINSGHGIYPKYSHP